MGKVKAQVMDGENIRRALDRLSHEITERNKGVADLVIIGIRMWGVPLAQRLAKLIGEHEKTAVPVGTLDITFYRDDLTLISPQPVVHRSDIPFDINGKKVVLADYASYTGRTVRAALDV